MKKIKRQGKDTGGTRGWFCCPSIEIFEQEGIFIKKAIVWVIVVCTLVAMFFLTGSVATLLFHVWNVDEYSTTAIEDYGKYVGNYDNKTVRAFINSFFPETIEDSFVDIVYSYRAQKGDTYAYEAYLEFTVEDPQEYRRIVDYYTANYEKQPFPYDPSFSEYIVSDIIQCSQVDAMGNMPSRIHIPYAKIGKILCSPEEQRLIFVALGVYDGGIATTDFLTVYFDRFQIDPLEYGKTRWGYDGK